MVVGLIKSPSQRLPSTHTYYAAAPTRPPTYRQLLRALKHLPCNTAMIIRFFFDVSTSIARTLCPSQQCQLPLFQKLKAENVVYICRKERLTSIPVLEHLRQRLSAPIAIIANLKSRRLVAITNRILANATKMSITWSVLLGP